MISRKSPGSEINKTRLKSRRDARITFHSSSSWNTCICKIEGNRMNGFVIMHPQKEREKKKV